MTESVLLSHVAAEVRAEMARQRKTQRDLAAALELSQAQVSDRLREKVAFDVRELEKVANWLGVPVSQFMPAGSAGAA